MLTRIRLEPEFDLRLYKWARKSPKFNVDFMKPVYVLFLQVKFEECGTK